MTADLEDRVGSVERTVERFDVRLGHVERGVEDVGHGVRQLLERDARRPDALTFRTVGVTLLSTGSIVAMMAAFTWWLIAASPAVQDLDRRVTKLDDPELGRVTRIEGDVRRLTGWEPQVVINRNR